MLVNYLLVGVIGFLSGTIVTFGYRKIRGRKVILPFIENTARNITIGAVILGLLSLTTIYNVERSDAAKERCDREFRTALAYNTAVTAQQRDLDAREDHLDGETRLNLNNALRRIVTSPSDENTLQVVADYNRRASEIDSQFASLDAERARLEKERKPYPEPSCGQGSIGT
ncbi:membrane protein [Gordonia phage Upyo]|nr:membrane protein [Gordonia phage Upyo]